MSQCTAKLRKKGIRCKRVARLGYAVCHLHGAGTKERPGGRPIVHGYYSKFLNPEETTDFEYFKQQFSLDEDLAFAATKVYNAAGQVEPGQLSSLLEVPSKIAERRKRIMEGVTLKVDVDMRFLHGFVEKVMTYVTDADARQDLLAYLREHMGQTAF